MRGKTRVSVASTAATMLLVLGTASAALPSAHAHGQDPSQHLAVQSHRALAAPSAQGSWQIETVDREGWVGLRSSIALDGSDYPHISYYGLTDYDLKYARWTGAEWDIQVVDGHDRVGTHTSLALDRSGNPHISYSTLTGADLRYARWTGAGWQIKTVDTEEEAGLSNELALDGDDYPHIVHYDYPTCRLKYTHWTGDRWSINVVDPDACPLGRLGLALDSLDVPHVSYFDSDNHALKLARRTAGGWDIQTVESGWQVSFDTSVALDSADRPHISYMGNDGSGLALKHAYWTGTQWDTQVVDDSDDVGQDSALALDAWDHPHISYRDEGNQDLKYARWTGEEWRVQTVDSEGDVGEYTSLALDAVGLAHIAYHDKTNHTLKYARLAEPPACVPGWRCSDAWHSAYQNEDCSWEPPVYCEHGCENGECTAPPEETIWCHFWGLAHSLVLVPESWYPMWHLTMSVEKVDDATPQCSSSPDTAPTIAPGERITLVLKNIGSDEFPPDLAEWDRIEVDARRVPAEPGSLPPANRWELWLHRGDDVKIVERCAMWWIPRLWADTKKLRAGECTTLHWDVEPICLSPETVTILWDEEGESVERQGAMQICPAKTTEYVLAVRVGGLQGRVSMSIEVEGQPVPPSCEPGWKCKDATHRGYLNGDCTWTSVELCEYQCEGGECREAMCTVGWKCRYPSHKAYQYADCSWGPMIYCYLGCENGECKPSACTVGWKCKDETHRAYQNANCSWSWETYCEHGCENGECQDATCASGWLCADASHRVYQESDCSRGDPVYCEYGCEGGICRGALPKPRFEGFRLFDRIRTEGATDWEAFKIGYNDYLAVANERNDSGYTVYSKIYKWDGSGFDEFQAIETYGADDWEFFTIDGNYYLALANSKGRSKIYLWKGTEFEPVQTIRTAEAMDWEFFTIDGQHYLAVANHKSALNYSVESEVYRWTGASFAPFQRIMTNGAMDWEYFMVEDRHFLAVANHYEAIWGHEIPSKVFEWDGSEFVEFASIRTEGASDWEAFSVGDAQYLAVANQVGYSGPKVRSEVYQWSRDGLTLVGPGMETEGASDLEFFSIGGSHYLAVANQFDGRTYSVDSYIRRWDGLAAIPFQPVPSIGAQEMETFRIDGRQFLAIASYYDGESYSTDSEIWVQKGDGCIDDDYGYNETCQRAREVGIGTHSGLRICPDDEDWFQVSLSPGDRFSVDVLFSHAQGDLDTELYNTDCSREITGSISATDNEHFEHMAESSGAYAVRVYSPLGVDDVDYELVLQIDPAAAIETLVEPKTTSQGQQLRFHGEVEEKESQDHIVSVLEDRPIEFSLEYPGSDLDLHVYGPGEQHVGMNYEAGTVEILVPTARYSGPGVNPEWIKVDRPALGDWRVLVYGREVKESEPYKIEVASEGGTLESNEASSVTEESDTEPPPVGYPPLPCGTALATAVVTLFALVTSSRHLAEELTTECAAGPADCHKSTGRRLRCFRSRR